MCAAGSAPICGKTAAGLSEPTRHDRLESGFCSVLEYFDGPARANWKGFLRLSLVTCPVALYPATSDSEKISFNQLNKKTGHRIKYVKVDADTGEEVPNEDITKGYKVDTDTYIEMSKDELENIALESTERLTSTSSFRRAASTRAISSGLTTSSRTAKSVTTLLPSSARPSAIWIWSRSVALY